MAPLQPAPPAQPPLPTTAQPQQPIAPPQHFANNGQPVVAQSPVAAIVDPARNSEETSILQRTIRITNLDPALKVKKLLKELVNEFGEVSRYSVEMDASTQTPIATIEFASLEAGMKAAVAGKLGSLKLA